MANFKYEGDDLETTWSFALNYHTWILSRFRNFLGKRVAEIGAGTGNFSALLTSEPIEELVVIEPAQEMYTQLTAKIADTPRIISRKAFFTEVSGEYRDYFDSIVYVNVLEHIQDDARELSCMYQSIRPGGYVCLFVPALMWLYSDYDALSGHCRRYQKKQLVELLKKAGFEIKDVRYFDIFGIIPWLVLVKLLGRKPTQGKVSFYDRFVVPIARTLESFIAPPLGKNLIIIGRKI